MACTFNPPLLIGGGDASNDRSPALHFFTAQLPSWQPDVLRAPRAFARPNLKPTTTSHIQHETSMSFIGTQGNMATDQNHVPRVHVPMPSDPEGLDRILDPEGVER